MQFYKRNVTKKAPRTSQSCFQSVCFLWGGQPHLAPEGAAAEEPVPSVNLLSRDKKQVQRSRKVPASVELMERRNVIGFLRGRQRGDVEFRLPLLNMPIRDEATP